MPRRRRRVDGMQTALSVSDSVYGQPIGEIFHLHLTAKGKKSLL